jgi:hypothetical protein
MIFVTQQQYGHPPVPPPYDPHGQQYAPHPQGQVGFPAPPPTGKKPLFKKPWFIVLAAIVAVGVIGAAVNGGKQDSADPVAGGTQADVAAEVPAGAPAGAAEGEAADAAAGIGQPAADGDFSFVVGGVDCSQTQIGNQYFNTTAQGQFCIVSVAVTNIGDSPASFFGENATLLNGQGQEFSADTEAAIYLDESGSIYEEINPGNTLNSQVVFDVPAGTVPAAIELHDSMLSGGVTVSLQ